MSYTNYNSDVFDKYINKKDYFGAANYLRSTKPTTVVGQRKVNDYIKRLEREGNIQEALYNRMDNNTKQAYDFIKAYDSGNTNPISNGEYKNMYADNYSNAINGFSGQAIIRTNTERIKGQFAPISSLSFYIEDKDILDDFNSNLGIQDIRNNNLNIKFEQIKDNQGYKLTINKDNPNFLKVYDAVRKTRYDDSADTGFWDRIINSFKRRPTSIRIEGNVDEKILSALSGGYSDNNALSNPITSRVSQETYSQLRDKGYNIDAAIATRDNIFNNNKQLKESVSQVASQYKKTYGEDELNLDALDRELDEINDAREKVNEFNAQEQERHNTRKQKLVTTGFLSAYHVALQDAYNEGKIKPATYEALLEESDNQYNRVLIGSDWAQSEVYSWDLDSGEGKILKRTDNDKIPDLQAEFEIALHDNRVNKQLAYMGGELGTLITIYAKPSSEKNNNTYSTKNGEKNKQIFLKGIFSGTYEDAYKLDTKVQAMTENEDMQYYGYSKSVSDTEKVGYDDNGQPYAKTFDSATKQWYKHYISEEQILDKLDDNLIIENTVLKAMENDDGNKDDTYYTTIFDAFAKKAMIDKLSEEMYPEKERIKYKNNMYQRMLNLLVKYKNLQNLSLNDDDKEENEEDN